VCKYCYIHKALLVVINCSKATSSAAAYLTQPIKSHHLYRTGFMTPLKLLNGQLSLRAAMSAGFEILQATANAIGSFDVQRFRHALVLWLLDNNLPMELISKAIMRELFKLINREVERALWRSPRSIATYAMRLFYLLQP
jgi:hypothetical protein